MNRHRISLITLFTLVTLVITPAVVAQIYKCDGPDGPVYSDMECGPDAANVKLQESSGLSGVSEKDKIMLAESKLEREQEREQARSRNQQDSVVNNQSNAYSTESPGVWNRPRDRINPNTLPAKTRPGALPAKPPPVTLPAKPRPAIQPIKR